MERGYNARSVERLTKFLKRCRQQLKNEKSLLWVSLQSNLLADLSYVKTDFQNELKGMKVEMERKGWILPTLTANMRNQVNIANAQIDKGIYSSYEMQSSIPKLKSGTSLIGEIPILFKVQPNDWDKKKDKVLKHCIDLMSQKSDKNIVVLWDDAVFIDVEDVIKSFIRYKKVVAYPYIAYQNQQRNKERGISNVKKFVEKSDYILVTECIYFNGCESANVIFLNYDKSGGLGLRNCVLRGVQNFFCIQLTRVLLEPKMNGMKEDNRFLREGENYESDRDS